MRAELPGRCYLIWREKGWPLKPRKNSHFAEASLYFRRVVKS